MEIDKITVEEAAERFGITARTLHYYEEIGLLNGVPRTEGGHRYYNEAILDQLEHILRLKDLLGISLQEIKIVLVAESRLTQLKESFKQEPPEEDRTKIMEEASLLLGELVERLSDRIDKLTSLREHFRGRHNQVNQLLKNNK